MPEWAGTVPGWITAGSVATMLGLWFRYLTSRRQQDGERLTDLEKENRQLRHDFDDYREKCIKEHDRLRAEIEGQRELVNGLRSQMRQLQMRGIEGAIEVPPATRERFKKGK